MTSACQSEDSKDLTAEFVAGLLTKYSLDLYKAQFQQPQYSKNNLPKDFDHLIAPFKISKVAKRIRCDLQGIAQASKLYPITPFNTAQIIPFLEFQTPYKPQIEVGDSSKDARRAGTAISQKRKGSSVSVDDSQKIVKRPRQSLESKRRISEVVAAIENTETKPPDNMYEVLQDVFQIFWELDIEPEVSAPFFSLITQHNCGPTFGMPDFFDRITESCTLANIKDKLEMRKYYSPSEFEFDFSVMFENIFTYYPKSSVQYSKAVELKDLFGSTWIEFKKKFHVSQHNDSA